jgi:sugar phosphate isomerase/epimerase
VSSPSLAVCSWSLSPADPAELVAWLRECGINAVQLALGPVVRSEAWREVGRVLAEAGVRIVSGMVGCVGEDYSTIESIRRTGGVLPDESWPMTLEHMRAAAPIAAQLGIELVTFHAGFIPADSTLPAFGTVRDRVGAVADLFGRHGGSIALETGQESAEVLVAFLRAIDRPDVGVNLDPANMLLYGSGDPIAALRLLRRWVRQVHIKDAVASGVAGQWGREVPAGMGEVDWASFFQVLSEGGYGGDYVIEREAGPNRGEDVRKAAALVGRYRLGRLRGESVNPGDLQGTPPDSGHHGRWR